MMLSSIDNPVSPRFVCKISGTGRAEPFADNQAVVRSADFVLLPQNGWNRAVWAYIGKMRRS